MLGNELSRANQLNYNINLLTKYTIDICYPIVNMNEK